MKTIIKVLVLSALLIVGVACSPIVKLVYGIKQPKPTSNSEVIQYANSLFEGNYKLYRPSEENSYFELIDKYRVSFPGIIFFDNDGIGVSMHKDTVTSCTANADSFIRQVENLKNNSRLGYHRNDIDALIEPIDDLPESSVQSIQPQYSIRVFWSDFSGDKLNKSKTKKWLATYKSLPDEFKSMIDIRLINMDLLPVE